MTTYATLDGKGVEVLLHNKKNPITTWDKAVESLKETGIADIQSGGGSNWIQRIAEKLTDKLSTKVIVFGPSPDYNSSDGVTRYVIEVKNNREASKLLSQTKD